ncbi:alpha/beta hydrolase [Nocardia sp.]|uniref:alpha/beta hydrolase n=1 Tax=Nocardia sp. TaxID=1821 RepID=UPI002590A3B8|nr:alpha/beta hydrolase [Nocardia sp.]
MGDNVFVATMSSDKVTWVGGNRAGRWSRFLGIGVDPSISAFGGRRVVAQYPATPEFADPSRHHTQYYDFVDAARTHPSEALENFGRIAAGFGDTVTPELHRPGRGDAGVLRRVIRGIAKIDPATTAHIDDGTQGYRPVDGPVIGPTGPEVQGHRGGRGLWAENTLPGFEAAMGMGVDVIELDVGLTADGVPVVHHEQRVDGHTVRDTGPVTPDDAGYPYVGKPIRTLTAAQIRTLDTGVTHSDFAETQTVEPGTRIPTLEEVARLPGEVGWAGTLAVEIKTDPSWSDADVEALVAATVATLRAHGARFRILGFDWRVLTYAQQHAPDVERVALVSARTADRKWMGSDPEISARERARMLWAQVTGKPRSPGGNLPALARAAGATILSPERSMVTESLMAQSRSATLPVSVWTVNDPADMHRLIELGVDALVSDFPDRVREVMAHRGRVLPEPAAGRLLPTDLGFDRADVARADRALALFAPDASPRSLSHGEYTDTTVVADARAKATANRRAWDSLDTAGREALLRVHPQFLGAADGIPAEVRDRANRLAHRRAWRELGARIGDIPQVMHRIVGRRLNGSEFALLRQLLFTGDAVALDSVPGPIVDLEAREVRRLLSSLGRADADLLRNLTAMSELLARADRDAAALPGSPRAQVLAYDPRAFHGDGRAVIAFGDVDTAEHVSWHVPGLAATVRSMDASLVAARNHYASTARTAPDTTVASIMWLGYDPPSGHAMWSEYSRTDPARDGGHRLLRDIAAFNGHRETGPAGLPVNHLIGHGYGSTAVGFAGAGRRLVGQVADVTLVGSPGVGPITDASRFGLGPGRVFVLTASSDRLTWRGSDTPATIAGPSEAQVLGVDPATSAFGAIRVAAEFPVDPRFASELAARHQYYWFTDGSRTTPTAALDNLGRIGAGLGTTVTTDAHRPGARETVRFLGREVVVPVDPAAAQTAVVAPSQAQRVLARDALDLLEPGIEPDLLRHGGYDEATIESQARAHTERIARWWHEQLGDAERAALIRVHPFEIGNADGIPAEVRDQANRLQITRDFDAFLARMPQHGIGSSRGLSDAETRQLRNLIATRAALAESDARAAELPDRPPVHVLSYDRAEFGGTGRAVVAVGEVDTAQSVSWIVPGITTTMLKLPGNLRSTVNLYEMTTRMNPDLRVATVMWIGYDAPNGSDILRETISADPAKEGARVLRRDMAGYRATREYLTGRSESAAMPRNYLFAHSYGSVATSYAAAGGRFLGSVEAVMLLGSPGVGPVHGAGDYGVPVYVASSSGDPVTWAGADVPGRLGRFAGRGQGLDPSTRAFEGVRVTAEFPTGMAGFDQHRAYFKYLDDSGPRARASESLRNAALLAAERPRDMIRARRRPGLVDPTWRQRQVNRPNDPEANRTAVEFDSTDTRGAEHQRPASAISTVTGETAHRQPQSTPRRRWLPPRREQERVPECGRDAVQTVSRLLPNADLRIPDQIGPEGMTAAELEAATGGRMRMYDSPARIAAMLKRHAQPGMTVLVVDEYSGPANENGVGAHAYVMTYRGGRVMVYDSALGTSPQPYRRGLIPRGVLAAHGILFHADGRADRPVDRFAPSVHRPEVGIGLPEEQSWPLSPAEQAMRGWGRGVEEDIGANTFNPVYEVRFGSDHRGVYKPDPDEAHSLEYGVPPSGLGVRAIAFSRLDELLGFGLVPPTTRYDGDEGPGSLMTFVEGLTGSEHPDVYDRVQQDRLLVLDYIAGNSDRHGGNWFTRWESDGGTRTRVLVPIDNDYSFPVDRDSFVWISPDGQRVGGSATRFVEEGLNRPLDPAVADAVRALPPERLRAMLESLGLEPEAIRGALNRLDEIQRLGMITAESWPDLGGHRQAAGLPPEPGPPDHGRMAITSDPAQLTRARRLVRDVMVDWADPDQVHEAALLAVALVRNVQQHTDTGGEIIVVLVEEAGVRRVRVEVFDDDPVIPVIPDEEAAADATSGLGLLSQLADDYDITPFGAGHGKAIWFEIDEATPQAPPWVDVDETVAALGDPVGTPRVPGPLRHANEASVLAFSDGSEWVYKPVSGEATTQVHVPESGAAVREVGAYALDALLEFGLVPPTTFYDGPRGPGSLQRFVASRPWGRPLADHDPAVRQMMAVLDYVGGNRDRSWSNYLESPDGGLVAIDNGYMFPDSRDTTGIRSSFVADAMNRPLDAAVLAKVMALDPDRLAGVLGDLGLDRQSIDGAVARLTEIQTAGRITGSAWHGDVHDVRRPPPGLRALLVPADAAERAVHELGPAVGRPEPLGRYEHVNEVFRVRLADGSLWVYKPVVGEPVYGSVIPLSSMAPREVAVYRLDRLLDFGLVPTTTLWRGDLGVGSLMSFAAQVAPGRQVGEYSRADRAMMAVLDYISGASDRHSRNYFTDPDTGRVVPFDHGETFPVDRHSFTEDAANFPADATVVDRFGFRSVFVADALNRALPREVLAKVRALDPVRLETMLTELGLERRAIDAALGRLGEIQAQGRITGRAWLDVELSDPGRGLLVAADTRQPALDATADGSGSLLRRVIGRLGLGGSVAETVAPNNCAPESIRTVIDETGSTVARVPIGDTGLPGMSGAALEGYAGGRLETVASRDDIADRLLDARDPARVVILVDQYRGRFGADEVGAHAYVMAARDGVVMVRDPNEGGWRPYRRGESGPDVAHMSAISFDADGNPLRPTNIHGLDLSAQPSGRIGATEPPRPEPGDGDHPPNPADELPHAAADPNAEGPGPVVGRSPLGEFGNVFRLEFADGSVRVHRIELDPRRAAFLGIPGSGLAVREVAMSEFDRMLGAGLVPSAVLWEDAHGRGSLSEFVPFVEGLPVRRYPIEQRHWAAVLDYVFGHIDRNATNWGTLPGSPDRPDAPPRILLLDNPDVLPEGPESFTFVDGADVCC